MPVLGSLMDFALSTPDHCRRLLLPGQAPLSTKVGQISGLQMHECYDTCVSLVYILCEDLEPLRTTRGISYDLCSYQESICWSFSCFSFWLGAAEPPLNIPILGTFNTGSSPSQV